jgi:hypothetical protein
VHRRHALKTPPGRHTVTLHGVAVGYSELEEVDPALGVARGQFRPGVGYDLVQPIFRLYVEAVPTPGGDVVDPDKLARYHRSRDALALALEDDAGRGIRTSAIHIADYSHRPNGSMQLEVLIADGDYWSRRDAAARG